MPMGRLGAEVFQSECLSHAGTEEMLANLSRSVGSKIQSKFFPSARETELLQILYLEFLVWVCPTLILIF